MATDFLSEPIADIMNTVVHIYIKTPFLTEQSEHLLHQLIRVGMVSTFTLIIDQLLY